MAMAANCSIKRTACKWDWWHSLTVLHLPGAQEATRFNPGTTDRKAILSEEKRILCK